MAHKKSAGSAGSPSKANPSYLGTKIHDGQSVRHGSIIIRQRGTKIRPGANIGLGRDHTLFALIDGIVKFSNVRKKHFNGKIMKRKSVEVVPVTAK